jgi:hypothetical protein
MSDLRDSGRDDQSAPELAKDVLVGTPFSTHEIGYEASEVYSATASAGMWATPSTMT